MRMRTTGAPYMVRRVLLSVLFIVGIVAREGSAELSFQVENLTWNEYLEGNSILEERGNLYGVYFQTVASPQWLMWLKIGGFMGETDYEGMTMDGAPAETTVKYWGLECVGDLGIKSVQLSKPVALTPFVGLRFRGSTRDIQDTDTSVGYKESWSMFFARGGLDLTRKANNSSAYVHGGVQIPWTAEKMDLTRLHLQNTTLGPKGKVSWFGEAGVAFQRIDIAVFYEEFRFDPSDTEMILSSTGRKVPIYQPQSTAKILGARVGLSF